LIFHWLNKRETNIASINWLESKGDKTMLHYLKTLLGFAVIGSLHLSSWAQSDWPKAKPVTLVRRFCRGFFD